MVVKKKFLKISKILKLKINEARQIGNADYSGTLAAISLVIGHIVVL
jgi:hypothetical protein